MSVFGGPLPRYKEEETIIHPLQYPTHVPVNTRLLPSPHRESVSSMTSASTESSPTTTISPFDSPGGGDISPSSSPESPSAMSVSYPKFMPSTRPVELAPRLSQPAPHNTRPESPNRRARNLKNLSLRMPPPSNARPPIATASVVETTSRQHFDGASSPIPIPSKSTRRRPANLTIQTPTFNKSFSTTAQDGVPPTPSLRHAESSPSLALITSPSFAPQGGMQLPRPMTRHGAGRQSGGFSDNTAPALIPTDGPTLSRRILPGLEEEDDHLDSRESTRKKDRGYPDGPIRIHDSGVYLYLEPTADEASKFDVVINVAKEVANPFSANKEERNDTVMSTWRNASMASKRLSRSEPQTAISEVSFKSAWEFQPSDSESATPTISSPITPTPNPTPEYIHVGWDHNSEILEDLLPLCELIDDRIAEGKKVLVHCQLGASRSASLVIAYGLYKNRHLDFNSMYEAVKGRSQWVGPNMSLIYQLTDFRSKLMRGSTSKPPPQEWFVQTGRRSSEPQVARAERPAPNDTSRPAFRGLSQAPSMSCLSIPETTSTRPTTSGTECYSKFKSNSPKRSLSPRPLPFRQKFQSLGPASGRSRGMLRSVSSCEPLVQTDAFGRDARDSIEGLFSPRTNEFLTPTPLAPLSFHRIDRSAALSPPPIPHVSPFATEPVDPRSPPSGGEPLIMRSIDEFL
jgi:tyrosine-protein phosphatase